MDLATVADYRHVSITDWSAFWDSCQCLHAEHRRAVLKGLGAWLLDAKTSTTDRVHVIGALVFGGRCMVDALLGSHTCVDSMAPRIVVSSSSLGSTATTTTLALGNTVDLETCLRLTASAWIDVMDMVLRIVDSSLGSAVWDAHSRVIADMWPHMVMAGADMVFIASASSASQETVDSWVLIMDYVTTIMHRGVWLWINCQLLLTKALLRAQLGWAPCLLKGCGVKDSHSHSHSHPCTRCVAGHDIRHGDCDWTLDDWRDFVNRLFPVGFKFDSTLASTSHTVGVDPSLPQYEHVLAAMVALS